ncbi:MAG: methyltransferase domain-containing protein [Saprospiraceae bacterium]|nr:methyltransferase domain-containing protein [Saprospiraceae bacterium]
MLFKNIKSNIDISDSEFDLIYPKKIKQASEFHFTPIEIAKIAAHYLADSKDTKVLDVGSGAGKFCMIGAACTEATFYGVELRKNLFNTSNRISKQFSLTNVYFTNSNINTIDFKNFDAVYFFNSFIENIFPLDCIDASIELRKDLYLEYSHYVKTQLDSMSIGTKLVTYFSFLKEVPDSFEIQYCLFGEKLKMWKKIS